MIEVIRAALATTGIVLVTLGVAAIVGAGAFRSWDKEERRGR